MKKKILLLVFAALFIPLIAQANMGGPDPSGYYWIDSKLPGAVIPYNWIDISNSGTKINLWYMSPSISVPIGFSFPFYSQLFSSVYVSTNGYLRFGGGGNYSNVPIPSPSVPNNIIAPFWENLDLNSGSVKYKTIGIAPSRIFIVQYSNVRLQNNYDTYLSFQILLHENGTIKFQYEDRNGMTAYKPDVLATVGIENQTGTYGLQYSYKENVISDGLVIAFSKPIMEVISALPAHGALGVPLNSKVAAHFGTSMPVDPATVIDSSIKVVDSVGVPVDGSVTFLPLFNTLEFKPVQEFAANEVYTVTVSSLITNAIGSSLVGDYVWNFTTGNSSDHVGPSEVLGISVIDPVANIKGTRLDLSWQPLTDADLSHYNIYRSQSSIGSLDDAILVGQTENVYFSDKSVGDGDYYYAVVGIDNNNNIGSYAFKGPYATIDDKPAAPKLDSYNVKSNGDGISIEWTKNIEQDLAGYIVYYGTSSRNYSQSIAVDSSLNKYLVPIEGLQSNTRYFVAIKAIDSSGQESQNYSTEYSVYSASPPPSGLNAISINGNVHLSWDADTVGNIRYFILRRGGYDESSQTTYSNLGYSDSTSFDDNLIVDGIQYHYMIYAYNNHYVIGHYTEEASVVAVDKIPPSGLCGPLIASRDSLGILVSWYNQSGSWYCPDVSGYNVYYGPISGGSDGDYASVVRNLDMYTTYAVLTGLQDCTDYYINVRAYDASGNESAYNPSQEIVYNSRHEAGPPQKAPAWVIALPEEGKTTVSWDTSALDCDVEGYVIYRSTDNISFGQIGEVVGDRFVDYQVVNDEKYYYKVKAKDFEGNIGAVYSMPSGLVYGKNTVLPGIPEINNAYYDSYSKFIYLRWNQVLDPDLKEYIILYGTESGVYQNEILIDKSNIYNLFYNLSGCTTYYFVVRATDSSGNWSQSAEKVVTFASSTTVAQPAAPVAVSSESEITLTWNKNTECDLSGYKIYRSTSPTTGFVQIGTVGKQVNTYTDRVVTNNLNYYYKIAAYNANTTSQQSLVGSALAQDTTPPLSPSAFYLSPGEDTLGRPSVYVRWPASLSPDIEKYKLYYRTDDNVIGSIIVPKTYLCSGSSSDLCAVLANLASCEKYHVSVKSLDYSGLESTSPANAEQSIVTYKAGVPEAPALVSAELVGNTIHVVWAANTDCDLRTSNQYNVWRKKSLDGGYTSLGTTSNTEYTDTSNLESDTTYDYVVTAFDKLDKISGYSIPASVLTLDQTPPTQPTVASSLYLYSPQYIHVKNSQITLAGSKDGTGSSISINGTEVVPYSTVVDWTAIVDLHDGLNILDISSTDDNFNTCNPVTIQVVKDILAPSVSSSVPYANSRVRQAETISVELIDQNNGSGVDLNASLNGATLKDANGNTVSGSGWQIVNNVLKFTPAAALPEGVYTVSLNPVDQLGNSNPVTYSFTVDLTPPQVQSLTMSPTSPHKAETVRFDIRFNETMNNTLPTVVFKKTGGAETITAAGGSWQSSQTTRRVTYAFSAATGDGEYSVEVSGAADSAGNLMVAQSAGTFVLDAAPPVSPWVDPVTSTPVRATTLGLSGTKQGGVAIVINNVVKVPLGLQSTWTASYPLREGENVLNIAARDEAGNDSTPVIVTVVRDTTPPLFTVDVFNDHASDAAQTLSGIKEPGCIVTLNGVEIIGGSDIAATWSTGITLNQQGLPTPLVFAARDALGNTTTKTMTLIWDAAPPPGLGPGVLVADGNGRGDQVDLSWNNYVKPDDLAFYRIYQSISAIDFATLGNATQIATTSPGVKAYTVEGLLEGTPYYFAVVPVDLAGNHPDYTIDPLVSVLATPADTEPPSEVTGFVAVPSYDTAGNSITLQWTASVDAVTGGDLDQQILYVDSGSGYGDGISLGRGLVSYQLTNLGDASLYKFKLKTKDEHPQNPQSQGVIAQAITRLANPANLQGVPGKNQAILAWGAALPADYLKSYKIYRKQAATPLTDISGMDFVVETNKKSYTDTGLLIGTTYQYAVTTVNTSSLENRIITGSTGVVPRADGTGPVIDGLYNQTGNTPILQNHMLSKALTLKATAHDEESAMGRVEIYIDNALKASADGAIVTYPWNLVNETDGDHVVKVLAYDEHDNPTELIRTVKVSLAPPGVPVHSAQVVVGTMLTSLTGTADLGTTITLRINNLILPASVDTDANGDWEFTNAQLVEGQNSVAMQATNRAGSSLFSPPLLINADTTTPQKPIDLTGKILPGGTIQFNWKAGDGEIPTGYNLYASVDPLPATQPGLKGAGLTPVNGATPIPYLFKEIIPTDDTARYYAVTARDDAGNESEPSRSIQVASDRSQPSVTSIEYSYNYGPWESTLTAGSGTLSVRLAVSEALQELPYLSLQPQAGSPVVLTPIADPSDPLKYTALVQIDGFTPQGATTLKFSGRDLIGNRGNSTGQGVTFDVKGPVATVIAPLIAAHIDTVPLEVAVDFDEPVVGTPQMQLVDAANNTMQLTGMATAGDDRHWTAQVDISGLGVGQATFGLVGATDSLGNIGKTVTAGKSVFLYVNLNDVPLAAPPAELTGISKKGGNIELSWAPVSQAASYKVYRNGASIFTPTVTSAVDQPPTDGTWHYSVASVDMYGEGAQSEQISADSDRLAPDPPSDLLLNLEGSGVKATWSWSGNTSDQPATFRLYRATSAIVSVVGLTPVAMANGNLTEVFDTSPVETQTNYALTALDALGNESAPVQASVVIPVAPVKSLAISQATNGAPELTWSSGAGLGKYYIYRNGNRINNEPTPATSYSDASYTGQGVTYGVSVVVAGEESPIREVRLPALEIGVPAGTILHRGLVENIPIEITSRESQESFTINSLEFTVGSSGASLKPGAIHLAPGETKSVNKEVSTALDAATSVAVLCKATLASGPGTSLTITRSSPVQVAGAGTSFEIFNQPLVRGTTGEVQIKVNNLGSAQLELLTSERGGATNDVVVKLLTEDGNLLAQGKLDQRTGGSVVNSNGFASARIAPGASFLSLPIYFEVPVNAPAKVLIEAVVARTYYHYQWPDQVTAPGFSRTVAVAMSDLAYRGTTIIDKANAATQNSPPVFLMGTPVTITGSALSNPAGQPVAGVPLRIGVSSRGYDRYFTVTTDEAGHYRQVFTPSASETGTYTVWASHPEMFDRNIQDTFELIGLQVSPAVYNLTLAQGRSFDVPVTLRNLGNAAITDVTLASEASTGLTVAIPGFANEFDLAGGKSQPVTLRVTAAENVPDNGFAKLNVTSGVGLSGQVDVNVNMVTLLPQLSASPSYIDTGMMRGAQKMVNFTLRNSGLETLENATIEGPSTPWIVLAVGSTLGDIAAGGSKNIALMLRPDAKVLPDVYDDTLIIYSNNHIPYHFNIQVTVSSDAVGSVAFDIQNEFSERLAGASIVLQHQQLLDLRYNLTTDADGTARLDDINEGRYSYNVSAPGCVPYSGTFVVEPGMTTTIPLALEVNMVEIEWSVVPTTIIDRYEIKITQTFETNIPAPVLITEPGGITLPEMLPGEVLNGEFTVTNYGMVEVYDVRPSFPTSFGDYDIEVMVEVVPSVLGAMQSIRVPYRVTRRAQTSANTCLFDEVNGFGGGNCGGTATIWTPGTYVICPNTPAQRTGTKLTPFYITIYSPCPPGSPSWLGGADGPGSTSGGITGGWGQGGGGDTPTQPTPITTGDPCECMNCDDYDACTIDSCSGGVCINELKDCDDGNACTADSCNGGSCQNVPMNCDDGNLCTTDSCGAGGCINEPKDCDDGDLCTDDTCNAGGCVNEPKNCDDGDLCKESYCDATIGCTSRPKSGSSPGDPCNTCIDGVKVPVTCSGSDPCMDYFCGTNGCESRPKDCDDGLMCTSADGINIGPDVCDYGTCYQKEINDKDTGAFNENFNVSTLIALINKASYALNLSGCSVESPSISGGLNVTTFDRCCEDEGIKSGIKYGGQMTLNFPGVQCFIPGLSTPPALSSIVGIGAYGSIGASCQAGAGGESDPCDADGCGWYVNAECKLTISGGVQGQVLDPKVISVSGGIQAAGSISYKKNCDGTSTNMCAGPLSVFVKVRLAIVDKSYNWVVPNTRICDN